MRAEDVLPEHINRDQFNGVTVRKGTVGAFLANARMFLDPGTAAASRDEIERHMIEALPALNALGLFEVFEIRSAELQAFVAEHLPMP